MYNKRFQPLSKITGTPLHTTPISLLEHLRQPGEPSAWSRFVKLYSPLLFYWARRAGLQEADAADAGSRT